METHGIFIGGEWTESDSGETFKSTNPADGSVVATLARGSRSDVDRAVLPFPSLQVDPYRGMSPHFRVAAARARAGFPVSSRRRTRRRPDGSRIAGAPRA